MRFWLFLVVILNGLRSYRGWAGVPSRFCQEHPVRSWQRTLWPRSANIFFSGPQPEGWYCGNRQRWRPWPIFCRNCRTYASENIDHQLDVRYQLTFVDITLGSLAQFGTVFWFHCATSSPVEMCLKPYFSIILLLLVPLPEPMQPKITIFFIALILFLSLYFV